jgi:endoglycosylceramidase
MLRLLASAAATLLIAAPAAAADPPSPPRPFGFLRVAPADGGNGIPRIVDAAGRSVLLKGVNVDGIVDYYRKDLKPPYPSDPAAYAGGACPPDDPSVEGVVLCQFDFDQMKPLGYDAIRLNVSWSLLEPAPGKVDATYLDRIAQVVSWAKARGLYVVIDMHQDAWSKYLYSTDADNCVPPNKKAPGYDGAPLWASAHVAPVCALNGVRELDPAVAEDFQRLWSNVPGPDGAGLQDHYAAVMTALAKRFRDEPAVAGYEIINEPSPGYVAAPGTSDATEIFPFYGKVVNAVTAAVPGFRQLFFVEPNTERNVTDQSPIVTPWSAYSPYPNVVYAPHVYTGVFTADQVATSTRFFPSDGGYRSAIDDASRLGLPLWIGEFGNNPSDDDTILRSHYDLQDKYLLGGTLWLWKENANDTNAAFFWGVYGPPFGAGTPQPKRIKYTSRAYPLATAGRLDSATYNPDSQAYDIKADSRRVTCGDRARATLVYLPAGAAAPAVEGAHAELFDRGGGSREAYVYPNGGPYRVRSAQPGDPPPAGCPNGRPRPHAHRHRARRHGHSHRHRGRPHTREDRRAQAQA